MIHTYSQSIDLISLERNWPEPHAVPPAILEFVNLICDWPFEAIGIFSIQGQRLEDYDIELGANLERFPHNTKWLELWMNGLK